MLPYISPPNSPRTAERRYPGPGGHIKYAIHTLADDELYARQTSVVSRGKRSMRDGGINDVLRVDGGRILREKSAQAVGEDGLRDGEEDGATEGVAEEHEGGADGGVGWGEVIL